MWYEIALIVVLSCNACCASESVPKYESFLVRRERNVSCNLLDACRENRTDDAVKLLTESKADPDSCDAFGRTVLMFAARHNNSVVIKTLLSCRVDVTCCDINDHRAIDFLPTKSDLRCLLYGKKNIKN